MDSVIKGEPAGGLFALYMSNINIEKDLGSKINVYKKESASGAIIIIESDTLDVKLVSIQNPKGEKMDFHLYSQIPYMHIDVSDFRKEEEYIIELLVDRQIIMKKFTLW